MIGSVTETSASYVLRWSLDVITPPGGAEGDRALQFSYEMEAFEDLYISDRLWDWAKGMKRIPDPMGIYRYVVEDSLRLAFYQAPHPPNIVPNVLYTPLFSRIAARETHRGAVVISLPVDEYSALARDITEPTELKMVTKVEFVLGIQRRADIETEPVPPPKETAESAGYIVHDPKRIVTACEVNGLAVKKRLGYMARLPLRGEPPPADAPMP